MKYLGSLNLWNAEQWKLMRYRHNWFSVSRIRSADQLRITIAGFTLVFDF